VQVSDKLIKPLTEIKYLNADNVSRYRCIMRIFFENYEKLKYWLYQEDIYEEMIKDPYFVEYKPEQCQQDLAMLVEWRGFKKSRVTSQIPLGGFPGWEKEKGCRSKILFWENQLFFSCCGVKRNIPVCV